MKRTILSAAVLGSALALAALLAPGIAAAAGPLPASSACTAAAAIVTCDLWAKTGTVPLPGGSPVTIWGYSATAGGAAQVPGPVLIVNEGDQVTVTLHNGLTRPSSILFGGQAMVSDITGAPGGGTTSYGFTADNPGTYRYEAGLIPGSQYQVAMGLYGALVVRPTGAPFQANGDPSTEFDDEALVVVGEIDPALNGSATPWTFDLRGFAPKWFLVNGTPFSSTSTPQITTTGGNTLLLRYVNAGIQHHSIGALGLPQRLIAADGSELPYPRTMVAETLAPGQTADVLADIPVSAATSTRYAIYDAAMLLNNSNVNIGSAYGIGGMLVLVNASGTPSGTDTTGPVTSGVTATPAGAGLYTLTATADETTTGGATIAAAEYRVDSTAATPVALSATDLAFDEVTEPVTTATGAIDTTSWTSGTHTIYVRARDLAGNWGAYASTTITLDKAGPTVSALALSPGSPSGTALAGTASDVATGNGNVVDAEYFIDTTGTDGSGAPMAVNHEAPIASITATIPDGTTGTVYVHALDAADNWGAFTTISLATDATGPATAGVTASPNPNNGTLGVNSSNPSVRVTAAFDDAASGGSTIAAAEGFIDTLGTSGTGFPFGASDGVFNAAAESGYADIPLTTIIALSVGNHTIHVHGRDAAGN
ncbi:MAG: multicopper oxidase domain-containing protein, partial [Acidimicrobiales bacterium]|nr:multicopper oxidase domain-containing protein [Acidimicrobiales bacterium]